MSRAWTVQNINQPSFLLKTQSKHRQVISSKFPENFRGARNLVVLGGFYPKSSEKTQKITKKIKELASETCLKSPGGVLAYFWEKSKFDFFYDSSPSYEYLHTVNILCKFILVNKTKYIYWAHSLWYEVLNVFLVITYFRDLTIPLWLTKTRIEVSKST